MVKLSQSLETFQIHPKFLSVINVQLNKEVKTSCLSTYQDCKTKVMLTLIDACAFVGFGGDGGD